jgi:hypothetical protein
MGPVAHDLVQEPGRFLIEAADLRVWYSAGLYKTMQLPIIEQFDP